MTAKDKKHNTMPTMSDVAKLAGVSQMTVSRVMRGADYISEDVQQRVRQAALEIGYVHNRFKSGMDGYGNPLVGVIVPHLQNRVFTEIFTGINDRLGQEGIRPVFGVSEYSTDIEEKIVYDLLSWRPRGLILMGLEHSPAVRQIIKQTGVRVAEVMDTDGEPISACFGISHYNAGEEMARHFIERGYRRFGYLASQGGRDLRANKRFQAFANYVQGAGGQIVDKRIADEGSSIKLGSQLAEEMLGAPHRLDAIYCSNDDIAAGVLMYCMGHSISIPDDIALAGFNGLSFLEALPQRVTTTETPRYEMGSAAANYIVSEAKEGEMAHTVSFKQKIIIGDTT
nr:LacI family DNA-binding transcriptional regulator [uncultured Cohaesibacter sp.]